MNEGSILVGVFVQKLACLVGVGGIQGYIMVLFLFNVGESCSRFEDGI